MVRETSGAASTVNEIIDMGIVALGVVGTGLVLWLYIRNRQMFMIIACLAILVYALSMLFFVNSLLYRMQFAGDVTPYRIIKWATIMVIALDLMLLVATISSDWWTKKKAELSRGSRSQQDGSYTDSGKNKQNKRETAGYSDGYYDPNGNWRWNNSRPGRGNQPGRGSQPGRGAGRGRGRGMAGRGQQPAGQYPPAANPAP